MAVNKNKKPAPKKVRVKLKVRVNGKYATFENFFKHEANKRGIFLENYRNAVKSLYKKYTTQIQAQKEFGTFVQEKLNQLSKEAMETYSKEVHYYQFKDEYDTQYLGHKFFLNGRMISPDQFFIVMDNFESELPTEAFLFTISPEINHTTRVVKLRINFQEIKDETKDSHGNYYMVSGGLNK